MVDEKFVEYKNSVLDSVSNQKYRKVASVLFDAMEIILTADNIAVAEAETESALDSIPESKLLQFVIDEVTSGASRNNDEESRNREGAFNINSRAIAWDDGEFK